MQYKAFEKGIEVNGRTVYSIVDGFRLLKKIPSKALLENGIGEKLSDGKVICGFAGGAADAFALMGRFEDKLEQYRGNVSRAAVELAKEALKSSTQRDVGSGNGIDVFTITKDGVKHVVSEEIVPEYK